jgi:myo-inositol-1-phosphate synthase
MVNKRFGIWFIGAYGGVATTTALGIASLKRGLTSGTGLVTDLDLFRPLELAKFDQLVIGGHDVRRVGFLAAARELAAKSGVFDEKLLRACQSQFAEWDQNVCPGTVRGAGKTVAKLSSWDGTGGNASATSIIDRLAADIEKFQSRHRLTHVVVINLASTEPPFELGESHSEWDHLSRSLRKKNAGILPASSLYAIAAISRGISYINFTPSLGATVPAIQDLASQTGALYGGQDGKTGETLLKSVLAPMFRYRNLEILSWVGHNIFGNRDGLVLDDPANKASKIKTKDQVITQIVGYKPQTHVSIEYIESLDDWKTAWDHIHFRGFLGTKMILQFTWQGCDSLLAAPLVIDLARLAILEWTHGGHGLMRHLACFFKRPLGVETHNLFEQWRMLEEYVERVRETGNRLQTRPAHADRSPSE